MRRFELIEGTASKFWEIEQADTELNIRWGRIGTAGQSQTKSFADATKAAAALTKLVNEKTGKGYEQRTATDDHRASSRARAHSRSVTQPASRSQGRSSQRSRPVVGPARPATPRTGERRSIAAQRVRVVEVVGTDVDGVDVGAVCSGGITTGPPGPPGCDGSVPNPLPFPPSNGE